MSKSKVSILEEQVQKAMREARIKSDTKNIVYNLLSLLKDKSPATHEHSLSVGILGQKIAKHMCINDKILLLAGLLHDCGKMQTDPHTLEKIRGWTDRDYREIKKHVLDSYRLLRGNLDFTAEVILWLHKFQKQGYPKKLPKLLHNYSLGTRALIPFYGRLVSLADCYDALHRVNEKFGKLQELSEEEIREKMFELNPDQKILIGNLYGAGILANKTNFTSVKEFDADLPKVLVGAPVYSKKSYITAEWISCIKNLSYPNYDVVVVDNSEEDLTFSSIFQRDGIQTIRSPSYSNPIQRITEARQRLYDYVVKGDYEYLMSIEQDILVPSGIIEALLSHKKPIVGAPYAVATHTNEQRRRVDYVMSASKLEKILTEIDEVEINEWYLSKELANRGLLQVKSCSLGCTLISTEVLKKISARSNPSINRADDSYFFQDCKNNGISVYVDTGLLWKVAHVKNIEESQVGGLI